jgi:hypothetical protein
MRQIQRKLGDEGFAAAIRLIEVLTYRSGSGTRFNPVLTLASPTNEIWLAGEILSYDPDDGGDEGVSMVDKLTTFLNEFCLAGLTTNGSVDGIAHFQEDGEWVHAPIKRTTIQLVEFEEMMDVWTARKHRDAQRDSE